MVEKPDLIYKKVSGESSQRGITGLEAAIILITFIVGASVFAFTVPSTGIFTSERPKETIFVGVEETKRAIEARGAVVGYKADRGGTNTIYKASLIVSNAVSGEPIDLTPLYTSDDSARGASDSVRPLNISLNKVGAAIRLHPLRFRSVVGGTTNAGLPAFSTSTAAAAAAAAAVSTAAAAATRSLVACFVHHDRSTIKLTTIHF